MSGKVRAGLSDSIEEIGIGLAIPITIASLVSTGYLPPYFIWIVSIIGTISLIKEMSLWSSSYMVGWLVGVIILAYFGLVSSIDFLIYFLPGLILAYRALKWIYENIQ
jgi:hypothetical protein